LKPDKRPWQAGALNRASHGLAKLTSEEVSSPNEPLSFKAAPSCCLNKLACLAGTPALSDFFLL